MRGERRCNCRRCRGAAGGAGEGGRQGQRGCGGEPGEGRRHEDAGDYEARLRAYAAVGVDEGW